MSLFQNDPNYRVTTITFVSLTTHSYTFEFPHGLSWSRDSVVGSWKIAVRFPEGARSFCLFQRVWRPSSLLFNGI